MNRKKLLCRLNLKTLIRYHLLRTISYSVNFSTSTFSRVQRHSKRWSLVILRIANQHSKKKFRLSWVPESRKWSPKPWSMVVIFSGFSKPVVWSLLFCWQLRCKDCTGWWGLCRWSFLPLWSLFHFRHLHSCTSSYVSSLLMLICLMERACMSYCSHSQRQKHWATNMKGWG